MTTQHPASQSLLVRPGQPLIGIPVAVDGQEMVRYVADEAEIDKAAAIQRDRELAGAGADLDWQEEVRELDRIRHERVPTPPIDDL